MAAPLRFSDILDFSAPAPISPPVRVLEPSALPAPTFVVVIRDPKTDEETYDQTTVGQTFKAVAADLAAGQIPCGHELAHVVAIDMVAGSATNVTARVLNEVARICEARGWSSSSTLDAAFDRYGIAPVLDPDDIEDPRAPVHAAEVARAERALIERSHERGADVVRYAAE